MIVRRIGIAVVVAAILCGVGACSGSSKPSAAGSPHPPAPVTTASAAAPPSAVPSKPTTPMCSVGKMTVKVDAADTGEQSGRESVVFDLHNTAKSACAFNGYPKLVVLHGTGIIDLKFPQARTGYATGVAGSGPIAGGGIARFTATIAITGCTKAAKHYPKLGIELPGVQLMQLTYPKQLARSGCPVSVTRIGPVTA